MFISLSGNNKTNTMKTIRISKSEYNETIASGEYLEIETIAVNKRIVRFYKDCGNTEELLIELINN